MYWALGAATAALVVALVIAFAIHPWSKSASATIQSFELDDGVSVDIRVPTGWTAHSATWAQKIRVFLVQSGDSRTLDAMENDAQEIGGGAQAPAIHMIQVFAAVCTRDGKAAPSSNSSWETLANEVDGQSRTSETRRLVEGDQCVFMKSGDIDASTSSARTASNQLESLIKTDAVMPRFSSFMPRPSRG